MGAFAFPGLADDTLRRASCCAKTSYASPSHRVNAKAAERSRLSGAHRSSYPVVARVPTSRESGHVSQALAALSSLASQFARWLRPPAPRPTPQAAPDRLVPAAAAVRTRVDDALPAVGVSDVIAPHSAWLQRLRYAYGAGDAAFEADIVGAVLRYAQYVHLLPATPDRHFRGQGGLFGMGLQIGFYALQATDGAIFSGPRTITQRCSLEPRWRYATFLAGLCSGLEPCLSQLTVTDDRGEEWPTALRPLALWLQDRHCTRYHVRWRSRPEARGALGAAAMSHIVSPALAQYLAQDNAIVVPELSAAIRGSAVAETHTLRKLVQRSSTLVIEGDRRSEARSQPWPGAEAAAAAPPAPLILNAPARLHPGVRAALQQIIGTLDSRERPPAAYAIDRGAFVPLREFEHRSVDPSLAVRELDQARMLAADPRAPQSKTCTQACAGELLPGVVLAPHSIRGLATCAADAAALKEPSR